MWLHCWLFAVGVLALIFFFEQKTAYDLRMSDWSSDVCSSDLPGGAFEIPADLVLLAMGFIGPEKGPLIDDFGVKLTDCGNVARDERWMRSEERRVGQA